MMCWANTLAMKHWWSSEPQAWSASNAREMMPSIRPRTIACTSLLPSAFALPLFLYRYGTPCPGDPEGCWTQALIQVVGVPLIVMHHSILLAAVFVRFERSSSHGGSSYCQRLFSGAHLGQWFSSTLLLYYLVFVTWTMRLHQIFEHHLWVHEVDVVYRLLMGTILILYWILVSMTCLEHFEEDPGNIH